MKIIGLRIDKYIGQRPFFYNNEWKEAFEEFDKHIIYGLLSDNRMLEIEIRLEIEACPSDKTTFSFGIIKTKEIYKKPYYTHIPIIPLEIEDIQPCVTGDINNDVFSTHGGYTVNMELFKAIKKIKMVRPVWLFRGKSNLGKSFLSSNLCNMDTYETDSNDKLPNVIIANIIVLGNKHIFSIDEVRSRIFGEYELIVVDFN